MLVIAIFAIVVASLVLIRATDVLTFHLKILAKKTALGGFFLTSVIVALATSLPELSVGITSALEGVPEIALGNVIGSNIANLSIIAGAAALIGGTLKVKDGEYANDFLHAMLAGLAPMALFLDGTLSRVDGLILIALYGFYNYFILSERMQPMEDDEGLLTGLIRRIRRNHTGKNFMYLFLSLAIILFAADLVVRLSHFVAIELSIPDMVVGLFIVAIGTSLPELAFGFKAIRKKEPSLFLGNLLGSTVANSTLIIGVVALINPIVISLLMEYLIATLFFLGVVFLFYFFIKTKHRLERWEGAVLMVVYILFLILTLI